MTTALKTDLSPDALIDLQLRIARRADRIAQKTGGDRTLDRQVWLRAEFEELQRVERARPRYLLLQAS
jgi:hypothetical protein